MWSHRLQMCEDLGVLGGDKSVCRQFGLVFLLVAVEERVQEVRRFADDPGTPSRRGDAARTGQRCVRCAKQGVFLRKMQETLTRLELPNGLKLHYPRV